MKTEFNFTDVIGRAKKALNIKDDKDFAERIGMKPTTFNSRKTAGSIPYDELLSLARTEKLDYNWLLTGEGSMYKDGSNSNTFQIQTEKMIDLFESLNDAQKREIFADAQDKKRLNDLESWAFQMQKQRAEVA